VYDAPDPSRLDRIQELLVDHPDQAGYRSAVATPATRGASLLTVKARRP
jgi:hypothetical protein